MTREPVIRSERRFLIFKKHEVANHRSRVIVWNPAKLKEIPGHKDHGGLQLALNNNLGSFKSKLHHATEKNENNQLKEKFLHSKGYTLFTFLHYGVLSGLSGVPQLISVNSQRFVELGF